MKFLNLPSPDQYPSVEDWARDFLQVLQVSGVSIELQPEDSLPIVDGEGRNIVESSGLTVYDGSGNTPIAGTTVQIDTTHLADAAVETNKLGAGAVTAPKVTKNEIVEINGLFGTDRSVSGPTGGTTYEVDTLTITANGGELHIVITCDIIITGYNEINTDDGPVVLLKTYIRNLTDASSWVLMSSIPLSLQPQDLTGTTSNWRGFGTVQSYWESTYSPTYGVGDSLEISVDMQLFYRGSATTCTLEGNDPIFSVIQTQVTV